MDLGAQESFWRGLRRFGPEAHEGLRVDENQGAARDVGPVDLGQPSFPVVSQEGPAQLVAAEGLKEPRAPEVEFSQQNGLDWSNIMDITIKGYMLFKTKRSFIVYLD